MGCDDWYEMRMGCFNKLRYGLFITQLIKTKKNSCVMDWDEVALYDDVH